MGRRRREQTTLTEGFSFHLASGISFEPPIHHYVHQPCSRPFPLPLPLPLPCQCLSLPISPDLLHRRPSRSPSSGSWSVQSCRLPLGGESALLSGSEWTFPQ